MNRPSSHQPIRLDEVLDAGRARLLDCRRHAESAIRRRPIGAVASALAVGWFSGKLGVARMAAATVRSVLPLAPTLLAALGAVRVWECLQEPRRNRRF